MESIDKARLIYEVTKGRWRPILVANTNLPSIPSPVDGFYKLDETLTTYRKMLRIDVIGEVISIDDSNFATTSAQNSPNHEPKQIVSLSIRGAKKTREEYESIINSIDFNDYTVKYQYQRYTNLMSRFDFCKSISAFVMFKSLGISSSTFIFPGDGIFPKTGFIFASLMPNSTCISIDPLMRKYDVIVTRKDASRKQILDQQSNLATHSISFEEYIDQYYNTLPKDEIIVLVYIHSHAPLEFSRLKDKGLIIISIPCCSDNSFPKDDNYTLLKEIVDTQVNYTMNTIRAYSIP
jgi:hypothetical protein